MFVYILFHCVDYEGSSFVGVFESLEAAQEKAADLYPEYLTDWDMITSQSPDSRVEEVGWYTTKMVDMQLRIGRFAVLR